MMINFKQILNVILLLTVSITLLSCNKINTSAEIKPLDNGSIVYDLDGTQIVVDDSININCRYNTSTKYLKIDGVDATTLNSATNTTSSNNLISFSVYNVNNINELVGVNIPLRSTSNGEMGCFMAYGSNDNLALSRNYSEGVLNITEVSGDKIYGTFWGELFIGASQTESVQITSGYINGIKLIVN